jgi:hypothetical protein
MTLGSKCERGAFVALRLRRTGAAVRSSILAILCTTAVLGCGAASLPNLDAKALHRPEFPALQERVVAIEVLDRRSSPPEGSEDTVNRIRQAVSEALSRSDLTIDPHAMNHLTLAISDPHTVPDGYTPESCVTIAGTLNTPAGTVEAISFGCAELRHLLFGMSLGSDVTKAYQSALNSVLDGLDRPLPPARTVVQ